MSQRAGTAESEIKALIEAWADAVRRHDLPAILAHHDDDIVMFDVPPPLQSRGLAEYKKTWDLFFAYHQPGQAFDVEELQMCVGDTIAFAVAIMRCGSATVSGPPTRRLPVSVDHRPLQGRRRLARPARAPFGAGDELEEPERRSPAPLFRSPVSARNP
jgi:ketosteroid isomerase-like protein